MPIDYSLMNSIRKLRDLDESLSTIYHLAEGEGKQDAMDNLLYAQRKLADAREALRLSLSPIGLREAEKMGVA